MKRPTLSIDNLHCFINYGDEFDCVIDAENIIQYITYLEESLLACETATAETGINDTN